MATTGLPPATEDGDTLRGFAFALAAYVMWGFLPLFMKALAHMPPVEVIAHRVIWSVPIALGVLIALGRTTDLRVALATPRMLAMGVVTATLVSINWGIYVWAIGSGRALDAALGYYINPLFSLLLGVVLLRERLAAAQWAAIGLAAFAVAILTVDAGQVPVAALGLTVTWGFYAYFKRSLPVGPNQGFTLEVLLLLIPALGFLVWLTVRGESHFLQSTAADTWLLLFCGVVTAVPLMVYANGAKLLRLSTIAIMQYISPTMVFLIAVFVFGEPMGAARMIAFPLIWAALVLYTWSMLRKSRG